jgi:hypothetical protein
MSALTQVGRLAMRREGEMWIAYYAMPDTMAGAILLGSIAIVAVETNPDRKEAFMALMRDFVSDLIEERGGTRPTWPDGPQPAPQAERSGRA